MGRDAVPNLLRFLDDESLWNNDSPGEGWPPTHAVRLLVELNATEAVQPMLTALCKTTWDEILHDRLVRHLPKFGAPVLEPALALLTPDASEDQRSSVCAVLSELGVRDDRIFHALRSLFEEDRTFGVICLSDYGDARALPLILNAIDEFAPDLDSDFWHIDLNEYVEAYARLGGVLPATTQRRCDDLLALRKKQRPQPVRAPEKVGRNDPCPCGSGLKYKKCCLHSAPSSP